MTQNTNIKKFIFLKSYTIKRNFKKQSVTVMILK